MGLLVITGAGVSLASGIPTFRGSDPGAIWKNDVMEKGTLAFFHRDPVASWRWYQERFLTCRGAVPNAAHTALAALEERREMLLVTQNVDTLHEQAGSRNLVKVHGSIDRVRCARTGCRYGAPNGTLRVTPSAPVPSKDLHAVPESREGEVDLGAFRREPTFANLPRCPLCRKLLRPHVLWFDECYDEHASYQSDRVMEWADRTATEVWFLGTSMSVGITDAVHARALKRAIPILVVNPSEDTVAGAVHVREPVEVWLPRQLEEQP